MELKEYILNEIKNYQYIVPENALGTPLDQSFIDKELRLFEQSLVEPEQCEFILQDTYEEIKNKPPNRKMMWKVAEIDHYILFYDQDKNEFGLAETNQNDSPITIGVRGDPVGAFIAR